MSGISGMDEALNYITTLRPLEHSSPSRLFLETKTWA